VSRGQNELTGDFKMSADDVITIRGQVMEHAHIPTGIIRELVRFGMDSNWKGEVVGTVRGGLVGIHSSGQTVFSL
jgi:hypothetical protein